MNRKVLILGGGVTGMKTATVLSDLNIPSVLVEKSPHLGGRVKRIARTFPLLKDDDFHSGEAFTAELASYVERSDAITIHRGCTLDRLEGAFPDYFATLTDGSEHRIAGVVIATGFEPFDPTSLPEYGYGRYPNVVTASELEWMLCSNGPTGGAVLRPSDGKEIRSLAIIFCVGSRNRRINAPFCSRICCSYSTKQAIAVVERHPGAKVTCFYMDVRTYDRGFEEMYSRAQERGVTYLRGRVSVCKELPTGSISLRAEHTLIQKMYNGTFDMVSLSTGMRPCLETSRLSETLGIARSEDGFFASGAWFRHPHDATKPGIFIAGCATGMKPIRNCIIDASAAAARIAALLNSASEKK